MRLLVPALALAMLASPGEAGNYGLNPSAVTDTVRFESTARLEFIEGTTTDIVGGFSVDPEKVGVSISGQLRVDLREIDTGIGLRNRHMRENHLETDKYPYAWFNLKEVTGLPSKLEPGRPAKGKASGDFYIHGGFRPIPADIEVTRLLPGETGGAEAIRVRATFDIELEDFDIKRPRALFLRVAETVRLTVVFTGFATRTPQPVALPDWQQFD